MRLYRHSTALAFLVDYTREARRLRSMPRQMADDAHLLGTWNFESPVERRWQRHALAVVEKQIGTAQWGHSLEIGCSEGVFTAELAQRCLSVNGCDISPVALARAGERCGAYANVRVGRLDVATEEIPGQYDLVFVMDVLWFVVGRSRQAGVATRLARALRDGGLLVFSDSRMPKGIRHRFWSLFFPTGADAWAKLLERCPDLTIIHKEFYPPKGQATAEFWEKLFVLFRKEPAGGA